MAFGNDRSHPLRHDCFMSLTMFFKQGPTGIFKKIEITRMVDVTVRIQVFIFNTVFEDVGLCHWQIRNPFFNWGKDDCVITTDILGSIYLPKIYGHSNLRTIQSQKTKDDENQLKFLENIRSLPPAFNQISYLTIIEVIIES